MTQATHSIVDDIVTAFGNSERFPAGSKRFEIYAPSMGQLVSIVGEDHLDDQVGMANLCDVTGRFVRSLAEDETGFLSKLNEAERDLARMLYLDLANQLEEVVQNSEAVLEQMGVTESEALEMDELGLNEAALELHRKGELTFRALLTTAPEVFIPRS